jgi:hypothetical protein
MPLLLKPLLRKKPPLMQFKPPLMQKLLELPLLLRPPLMLKLLKLLLPQVQVKSHSPEPQ